MGTLESECQMEGRLKVSNPRQRALKLAVHVLGGSTAASDVLQVGSRDLELWLASNIEPPVDVLMRALDVILQDPALAARHAVLLGAQDKHRPPPHKSR
jgi:hypothetical protein